MSLNQPALEDRTATFEEEFNRECDESRDFLHKLSLINDSFLSTIWTAPGLTSKVQDRVITLYNAFQLSYSIQVEGLTDRQQERELVKWADEKLEQNNLYITQCLEGAKIIGAISEILREIMERGMISKPILLHLSKLRNHSEQDLLASIILKERLPSRFIPNLIEHFEIYKAQNGGANGFSWDDQYLSLPGEEIELDSNDNDEKNDEFQWRELHFLPSSEREEIKSTHDEEVDHIKKVDAFIKFLKGNPDAVDYFSNQIGISPTYNDDELSLFGRKYYLNSPNKMGTDILFFPDINRVMLYGELVQVPVDHTRVLMHLYERQTSTDPDSKKGILKETDKQNLAKIVFGDDIDGLDKLYQIFVDIEFFFDTLKRPIMVLSEVREF